MHVSVNDSFIQVSLACHTACRRPVLQQQPGTLKQQDVSVCLDPSVCGVNNVMSNVSVQIVGHDM